MCRHTNEDISRRGKSLVHKVRLEPIWRVRKSCKKGVPDLTLTSPRSHKDLIAATEDLHLGPELSFEKIPTDGMIIMPRLSESDLDKLCVWEATADSVDSNPNEHSKGPNTPIYPRHLLSREISPPKLRGDRLDEIDIMSFESPIPEALLVPDL